MIDLSKTLGTLSAGKVLDVATGGGGFIHFLLDELKEYEEITGIDVSERSAAAFAGAFKDQPGIHFIRMDAIHMDFPDASFDTVCMANSLHHFSDPRPVLAEMQRVLRPAGNFILLEMYRDNQAETQQSHVLLHHWWGAVDRIEGIVHHETYTRAELVSLMTALELSEPQIFDLSDLDEDPHSPEILAELEPVIERYIQRANGHPDLQAQGESLRVRLREVGFHSAASLLVLAKK